MFAVSPHFINIIGELCVLRYHDRMNFKSEFPTDLDFDKSVFTLKVVYQERWWIK